MTMTHSLLRVLTYHRVLEPTHPCLPRPAGISATPRVFEQQMRHLARHYRVVSAAEVLAALRDGTPRPPRAVLLTFDDAYQNFGDIAWPMLRRHGLPVTLFVPTAFPDHPEREFWWDRLHRACHASTRRWLYVPPFGERPIRTPAERAEVCRALEARAKAIPHDEAMQMLDDACVQLGDCGPPPARVLGWDALRRLARDGVTLAPHTQSHAALPQLSPDRARAEIRGSRDDLRREIGEVAPVFAYPFGAHDDAAARLLREEGFELALTCHEGHNRLAETDPLRLRRTNISTRTSLLVFRARLSPLAARVDQWRHA